MGIIRKNSDFAEAQDSKPGGPPSGKLGTGEFNCLCFRKIGGLLVADFTTIPEPIGEQYQFDPSCPFSGIGSIVMEKDGGEIVDYDPREVPYVTEESPEYAYLATHWKAVTNGFWKTPFKWWQNASTWLAGVMVVLVFFTTLMLFD